MLMMVIGGNDHSDHFQKQTWLALPLDSLPQRGGAVRPLGAQDAHPGERLILGIFVKNENDGASGFGIRLLILTMASRYSRGKQRKSSVILWSRSKKSCQSRLNTKSKKQLQA